jgi:hypothetical protein
MIKNYLFAILKSNMKTLISTSSKRPTVATFFQ